jgi:hypothetical protein
MVKLATMASTPFGSLPRTTSADLAAITGYPKRRGLSLPGRSEHAQRELPARGAREHLRNGPVVFHLLLQLAGEADPTDDVTALWPADRTMVELGRLEVTAPLLRVLPTNGGWCSIPPILRTASISRRIQFCWHGRPLTPSPTATAARESERSHRSRYRVPPAAYYPAIDGRRAFA